MKGILKKIFSKKEKTEKPAEVKALPKPMFNFVQQYTLVNPNHVMIDYSVWSLCEEMPVAYEKEGKSSDFAECIRLPTKIIGGFLYELQNAPGKIVNNPVMRTVSVINLKNGKKNVYFTKFTITKNSGYIHRKTKRIGFPCESGNKSCYCKSIKIIHTIKTINPDKRRDFLFHKLTICIKFRIISLMKKIILFLCLIMLVGCGVRSELVRDPGYPRTYPVY